MKVEQFALYFATYRLGTPLQSFATQFNVVSQSNKPSAHTRVLGTDIKCRLYSNNSTADLAISTAATTFLHRSMKTHVTPRLAFKSSSEKQAGVEKTVLCMEGIKSRMEESSESNSILLHQ